VAVTQPPSGATSGRLGGAEWSRRSLWGPAGRSSRRTSPDGVSRLGGQAGTQAPDPTPVSSQNQESRAGSAIRTLPADSARRSTPPDGILLAAQILLIYGRLLGLELRSAKTRRSRLTSRRSRRRCGSALSVTSSGSSCMCRGPNFRRGILEAGEDGERGCEDERGGPGRVVRGVPLHDARAAEEDFAAGEQLAFNLHLSTSTSVRLR